MLSCWAAELLSCWAAGLLGRKDPESEGQDREPRRRFVQTLCRIEPSIAEARGLAQRFPGFIHRRDLAGFDRWLPRARSCAVPELRRLVARLDADLSAVRAAFSSPWSNGRTEGHVDRLDYLEKQMYGRAKLDLPRIRVLHPNRGGSHRTSNAPQSASHCRSSAIAAS